MFNAKSHRKFISNKNKYKQNGNDIKFIHIDIDFYQINTHVYIYRS